MTNCSKLYHVYSPPVCYGFFYTWLKVSKFSSKKIAALKDSDTKT